MTRLTLTDLIDAAVVPALADKMDVGTLTDIPAYGILPARYLNTRKAFAGALAGTRAGKILCVGDSTTWGRLSGTTGNPSDGYPHWLEKLLGGVPGLAIPPANVPLTDPRWVAGTGWSIAPFGFANGAAYLASAGAVGALTFTPGVLCDTFDVYWLGGPSNGTVQASVGGATATAVVTTNATPGWYKTTVTAPGLAVGHTLTFQTVTTNPVYIAGVSAYDSTTPGLRIGNAGVSGTTSALWADATARSSLNGIRAVAPDLTIVMLGINDAGASVSVATWEANITAIVQAAQESGDVLLMSVVPSQSGVKAPIELTYQQALGELADSLDCGWVDIWTLFGGSYATANALGYMADSDHPTPLGYAVIARAVGEALSMTPPTRLPYYPLNPFSVVRPSWMPNGLSAAITNGTANTIWYYRVAEGGTISKVRLHIVTNSGNVCVAAYANNGSGLSAAPTGGLLASSGSVTPGGTGAQDISLGQSVTLQPGDWIAVGWDNTTATAYGLTGAGASSMLGGEVCSQAVFPAPAIPSSLTIQNNRMFAFVGVP